MARGLVHTLRRSDGSTYYPWHLSQIRYGRCTRPHHVENELWFVTIPQGESYKEDGAIEDLSPEDDHTFFVSAEYARPLIIEELRRDINKWRAVAHKVNQGDWCEYFECLWKDVPVNIHQLPNGSVVKYGYCRTQPPNQPERELWFVAFRDASPRDHPSTFVVDKECVTQQFLDRMGNDHWKWMTICWCRLDEGNEIQWSQLETGTLDGGCARSHSSFAFDSPYLPFSTNDIPIRIQMYEDSVRNGFEEYQRQNQSFFNRKKKWTNLTDSERNKHEVFWRRKACEKILEMRR